MPRVGPKLYHAIRNQLLEFLYVRKLSLDACMGCFITFLLLFASVSKTGSNAGPLATDQ